MSNITTKKHTIDGNGWTKVYHNVLRNGVDIGTAFINDDGSVNLEEAGRASGDYENLEAAKAACGKRKYTFMEKLADHGIT